MVARISCVTQPPLSKTAGYVGRSSLCGDYRLGPARCGDFQADSRAGSARDEKKPAVVMSNTSTDLQDFYGSDGTNPP